MGRLQHLSRSIARKLHRRPGTARRRNELSVETLEQRQLLAVAAMEDFDGSDLNLLSFSQTPAAGTLTAGGDMFEVGGRSALISSALS